MSDHVPEWLEQASAAVLLALCAVAAVVLAVPALLWRLERHRSR